MSCNELMIRQWKSWFAGICHASNGCQETIFCQESTYQKIIDNRSSLSLWLYPCEDSHWLWTPLTKATISKKLINTYRLNYGYNRTKQHTERHNTVQTPMALFAIPYGKAYRYFHLSFCKRVRCENQFLFCKQQ